MSRRAELRRKQVPAGWAALLALAVLALTLAGCGGGGGGGSTSTAATSTARAAQIRRAEAHGQNPSGAPAYNQNLLPFRAAPLSASQRRRLAKDGATDFAVRLGKPGAVSAWGQAQLGLSIVRVANAASVSSAPGAVTLHLTLTPRARRFLAKGHSMLIYLAIRSSRSRTAQQLVVPLKG